MISFLCIFIVWLRSKIIYFYSTTIFGHISSGSALHGWSDTLLKILNELSDEDLKKMKYSMCWNEEYKIYRGSVEHRDRVELADLMLKQWGEWQSVLKARDLVKKIPRNDEAMIELFEPFLKSIGDTWWPSTKSCHYRSALRWDVSGAHYIFSNEALNLSSLYS